MAGDGDRPFRRQVLRNSIVVGASNGWAVVVSLVTLPLLLHGLGPRQFGLWVLLQVFSASSGWLGLVDLGLGTAATRALAASAARDDRRQVGAVLGTTVASFGGLVVAGSVLTFLITWPLLSAIVHVPAALAAPVRTASEVLALQVAAELALQGLESCLEGLQRVDLSRAVEMARRALFAFGAAGAALATGHLLAVEVAATAGTGVALVVGLVVWWRRVRVLPMSVSPAEARALVRYAAVVAPLRPISSLFALMDRVIVGAVLGPAAVSLVEVATQIANGIVAVSGSLSYALLPGSAWVDSRGDTATLRQAFVDGTRYTLLVAWSLAVGAAVFAPAGIAVWVGARYHGADAATVVAVSEVGLTMVAQVASIILLGTGRASVILRVSATGVVVDLALSLWLVHPLGVAGVFWGTVGGSLVMVPWLLVTMCRQVAVGLGEFLRAAVAPLGVPVALEVAVCALVANAGLPPLATLLVGVPLGGVAFALGAWRFTLHRGELATLWSQVRSRSAT